MSAVENKLYISLDERRSLERGLRQLQFMHYEDFVPKRPSNSKVFKDYILSPEVYNLQ